MRVHADPAVELRVGHPQPAVAIGDEHVQPLDQLADLLAIQLAAELVELRLLGLGLVLALVVAALQAPHVSPVRRRRIVGPEQIERGGNPLVEEPLDHFRGHLARLDEAEQSVVADSQVERLFFEHRVHRARQRIERGDRQHGQLKLAVPVDELCVREEIEPVVHQLVERAEQPLALVGAALEQLRRLTLALVAEVGAQQIGHLPAVAHLFGHHSLQRQQVVIAGGVLQQVALLLHRGELGVALVDDEIEEGVADPLVGNMHDRRPLALAPVMAELDVGDLLFPELRLELEAAEIILLQPDRVLPVAEVVDPVVEVMQLAHHQRLLVLRDFPMRSRASGVANSSFW